MVAKGEKWKREREVWLESRGFWVVVVRRIPAYSSGKKGNFLYIKSKNSPSNIIFSTTFYF